MRCACFLALCAYLAAAAVAAVGQTAPSTPTFKSRADLVLVPVIVRDSRGNHVSGLTLNDFKLQQDETEQRIATVEEIASSTTTMPPAV